MLNKLKLFHPKFLRDEILFQLKFWQTKNLKLFIGFLNLLVVLIFSYFFVLPQLAKITNLQSQLNAKPENEKAEQNLQNADHLKKKSLALLKNDKLINLADITTLQPLKILQNLRTQVQRAQLKSVEISPQYANKKLQQISITSHSNWTNLAQFINSMQDNFYIFRLANINLRQDAQGLINCELVLALDNQQTIFYSEQDFEQDTDIDIFVQLNQLNLLKTYTFDLNLSPFNFEPSTNIASQTSQNKQTRKFNKQLSQNSAKTSNLILLGMVNFDGKDKASIKYYGKVYKGLAVGDYIANSKLKILAIDRKNKLVKIKDESGQKIFTLRL